MSNSEQVQALADFGLTETQARVYINLMILGTSDAKTVGKSSKVPRQDIYRVLDELFELGLLEKIAKVPKEYKAVPIDECIKMLAQRTREQYERIQKTARKVFKSLDINVSKQKIDNLRPMITVVSPEKPVIRKARDLLGGVEESLRVVSPLQKLLPWIFEHSHLFDKALKKKVGIRLLTSNPAIHKSSTKCFWKFEKAEESCVKYLPEPPKVSFGIYDNRKLILELDATGGYLESETLISDNPCLVEIASGYFEFLWSKAKRYNTSTKSKTNSES